MSRKIVIVGAGVAGINAATKLVDNGYPGSDITIIDMGKDPQVPVFLWRFSNHDFGLWQIEANGTTHVYTLARVGGA
jgi:NADH dehydrogenase FAD-containing subunit